MNFFHLLDNISYSPVAESAPLPMWQCSLHRRCVQQSRDRHGWWRRQDRHLQSWSGGSDSSHRFAPPPPCIIKYTPCIGMVSCDLCVFVGWIVVARECWQQHHTCCHLFKNNGDFDRQLYRPTQDVGFQTTEQFTVSDSLLVWAFHFQPHTLYFYLVPPVTIYLLILRSGDRVPLHCVDRHPNQQHIVATGGQDGMLCVWDMRQGSAPFSLMEAHSAESKVSFELHNWCLWC